MKFLSAKKLILIGFIVVLLIAIPLTIFILQQQQQTETEAEQATTLSFEPNTTSANPIQAGVGQPVSLDVIVDPGVNQNLVSFVRLEIQYDPTKLTPIEATEQAKPFEENTAALTLLEGPVITDGTIAATLSVGVDPTKVIQTKTTIATINFIATATTGDIPTEVTFTTTSQVLSAGSGDQANENVLASRIPAYVAIAEGTGVTPSVTGGPTATPSGAVTTTVTSTPSPTVSTAPAATSGAQTTPSPTTAGATGASTNQAPVCEGLTASALTGAAPFTPTFTVKGSDLDGLINRATLSYGDTQIQNITVGGGLTTSSVDLPVSHTYTNPGSYQVTVVLTDDDGGVSGNNCTLTVTATEATTADSSGTTATADGIPTSTPVPDATLPDTGPGDVLIGMGLVISVITILGGILFFSL